MLYVIFTKSLKDEIISFKELKINEAVDVTSKLEKKYVSKKKVESVDFFIVKKLANNENETVYSGTFDFGSGNFDNLYHHVKSNIDSIKVKSENKFEKHLFLELLEKEIDANFKEESYNKNSGVATIKNLNKKQKLNLILAAIILTASTITSSSMYFYTKNKLEQYEAYTQFKIKEHEQLIETYEEGLLGNESNIIEYLMSSENNSDNQKEILTNNLIKNKDYNKLMDYYNNPDVVVDKISNNKKINMQEKVVLLREFDEKYPTNDAKFDLSYYREDYETLLTLTDVNESMRRSRMKTYAYLKTGDIENAKEEWKNNHNEKLGNDISKYEELSNEIKELETKGGSKNEIDEKKKELDNI